MTRIGRQGLTGLKLMGHGDLGSNPDILPYAVIAFKKKTDAQLSLDAKKLFKHTYITKLLLAFSSEPAKIERIAECFSMLQGN